jgi:hypothetical protein
LCHFNRMTKSRVLSFQFFQMRVYAHLILLADQLHKQ